MTSENTLPTIEQSSLLSETDLAFVKNNIDTLQQNWKKRQIFRTQTEMIVSVLNDIKFPTKASKYWQSVREQSVFYQELVRLSFDYRRNEIQIKKIKQQLKAAMGYKKDMLQIDLEEKLFASVNMESLAKDRIREIKLWQGIMAELDDGSFDTQDANIHQLESYVQRFNLQAKRVTSNTPPADANNIMGQKLTAERIMSERIEKGDENHVY